MRVRVQRRAASFVKHALNFLPQENMNRGKMSTDSVPRLPQATTALVLKMVASIAQFGKAGSKRAPCNPCIFLPGCADALKNRLGVTICQEDSQFADARDVDVLQQRSRRVPPQACLGGAQA